MVRRSGRAQQGLPGAEPTSTRIAQRSTHESSKTWPQIPPETWNSWKKVRSGVSAFIRSYHRRITRGWDSTRANSFVGADSHQARVISARTVNGDAYGSWSREEALKLPVVGSITRKSKRARNRTRFANSRSSSLASCFG